MILSIEIDQRIRNPALNHHTITIEISTATADFHINIIGIVIRKAILDLRKKKELQQKIPKH
jgi:hypothetical protein